VCCNYSSWTDGAELDRLEGDGCVEILTPPLSLVSDAYNLDVLVRERAVGDIIAAQNGANFHVRHDVFDPAGFGIFHEQAQWYVAKQL
jgi:lipopolysaccharide transport system ATP-binding protein